MSDVSLGSGLYKVRLALQGKGKSGGYRTLLIYKKNILQFTYMVLTKVSKIISAIKS